MNITRKTVLTLLAALLALPTFLIVGAAAPASAARNPGLHPTMCVNDVVRQFNSLKHHPEGLGFHLGAGAHDPTSGRHYQGIVRIPGEGPPRFVTSKNGNVGDFELPGQDDQPGEINVIELASRDTNGERVRSNRMVANESTQSTPPPAEDRVIRSIHTGEFPIGSHFRHLGGMQTWGQIALVGMDRPYFPNNFTGEIVLLDFGTGPDPEYAGSFLLGHQASSVGIAPFADNTRLLLITTGNNGSPIYGYEVIRNGKSTVDLRWNPTDPPLYLKKVFEYDAAAKNVGWPTGFQSLQTTNLFTDCNTGEMFLMGGYNLSPFENTSRDRLGIWKIDPLTGTLTPVNKRQIWCEFDHMDRVCNMAAASGFYVSPSGDLIMYATEHENDGPGGTVRMSEFSSQDGYDQDGAYRPTSVPGGAYTGQPNVPVAVDGSASTPAVAQARVELYDEPNFGGRGLVIDYPDHGKEDYRHLSRVDDYNDEASSVRWRIPKGCEAVLFDDKDYRGPRVSLPAAQGGPQANANLRSFNDDTTSVNFYGDCDGRITSWSWDLGDNGSVDATGPTATVTATTPGVHKLALTVCSGFGVCDKKLTTLDASPAGTLPKTTATLAGIAGTAGWYRSAVTVNLNATGTPAPTEIRYSATGADPMAEQAVTGSSASLTVDAQGVTTVSFRALNTAGEEAVQTVTVKVDTVAPALTVRTPMEGGRYVTGSAVTVAVSCTDATSGVASCTPNGQALDTTGTGPRTLTATVTDAAGNTASKPVGYTLVAAPAVAGEIVYVARSDASPGPIQRSNTDGSNVVQLAERGNDPVFSPDGSRVAYVEIANGARQVVTVDAADGGNKTVVTGHTTGGPTSLSWSPDGSRIVYSASWTEGTSPDLVHHRAVMSVPSTGGASTTLVASTELNLNDPVYTRNGANITYVAGTDIMSIPAAGVPAGQLGTVLVGGLYGYHNPADLAWSPDGSTLTFQVWERETGAADLYSWSGSGTPVNLTGTQTAWPLLESPDAPREDGPTYLPDGRVLFVQDGNVWMMPAQPGAQKVLLADPSYAVRDVDAKGA